MTYGDLGYTIWDGVLTVARQWRDDLFLFAANAAFDPARPTFAIQGFAGRAAACVEGEEREVPIEGGRLTDDFAPYAVHVYRINMI